MIGPPIARTPCLDNFLTWSQYEIEAGEMVAPGRERATDISAYFGLFSRQRRVLAAVHNHLINRIGSGIEDDGLPDGRGIALLGDAHGNAPFESAHKIVENDPKFRVTRYR